MISRWRWIAFLVAVPLAVIALIAASEGLFLRTVPLEQRLLSRNESIRKKAQQGLLGQSTEQKQETARRLIPALSQQDAFARKWAAISLALIGPAAQEAIPALLQDVSDKEQEVAQAARVALNEIGAPDPGQLPTLMQALGNTSEAVQCEAVTSIAKLGPAAKDATPLLLSALERNTPLPDCYVVGISGLSAFFPQMEMSLGTFLQAKNPSVRQQAAMVLSHIPKKSTATVKTLFQGLAHEPPGDVQHSMVSALTLQRPPAPGYASALGAGVTDATDAAIRYDALTLLKTVSPAPAWIILKPALDHALHDINADLRGAALEWISEKPEWTRAFAPILFNLLNDPMPAHRRLAMAALYNMPWHGREHLRDIALMQQDSDAEVRCLAVRQLVEMGHAEQVSVSRLTTDLKQDPDPSCAVEALALTGYFNPTVVPAMVRLLGEKDWRAESRAVLVLLHLGPRAKSGLNALLRAQREEIPGAENAILHIRQGGGREKRKHHS